MARAVDTLGIRIGDTTSRFELLTWNEPSADRVSRRFVDHAEALRFVQRHLFAQDILAGVRHWGHDLGLYHPTHHGFMQMLANAIMQGKVWVAELEPASTRHGGGGSGGGDGPGPGPGPNPGPGPKPKPKPVAELVVIVKDLNGKPVAGATVTAGALGSMTTDKDGVANYGKVTPGSYDITAAKPGHGKLRNGIEEKDEKKAVSVPDGSKTEVKLVQHPECANVAFFEGPPPPGARMKYFGFDHKTNIKPPHGHPYWDPVPAKGALHMPADRLIRNESRWVSVAVGQEAEIEINFAFLGAECIPCLANTTFQVLDGKVAEVVTAHVTAKKAAFKIKGKGEGESSLKVICDGHEIGWFHIWCAREKTINLDLCLVTTNQTTAASYDATQLTARLNRIYRQAALKISVLDLGSVDLSANAAVATAEATVYPTDGSAPFSTMNATLTAALSVIEQAAHSALTARATGPKPRNNTRKLIFYVPALGCNLNGMALNIGFSSVFVFYDTAPNYYSTAGHELGHSLSLRHPSDPSGASQYASHNFATAGQNPTPAWPATHTEPATAAYPYTTADEITESRSVMGNDPLNLMGYWHDRGVRNQLRYHQWKAVDRK